MPNNPRKYDIIVYGATGFTGKKVAQEIGKFPPRSAFKWAVGGRDEAKLNALVESLDLQNNCPKPDIIIADVTKDESKLKDLAQSTKVVISCVGPFRFFGEPIVKACAESGTNYVDINGETEFIEGIYAKYDQVAKKNGACIVSAAGFDSVPADLGCLFTKIQYSKNNAVATSMEMFHKLNSGSAGLCINATTFESAVHGFANASTLRSLRKRNPREPLPIIGPVLNLQKSPKYDPRVGTYTIPAQVADVAVVKLGQQILESHKKEQNNIAGSNTYKPPLYSPAQFAGYFSITSFIGLAYIFYLGLLLQFMTRFSKTRNLLIQYPEIFTLGIFKKSGPNALQLSQSSFETKFLSSGYKLPRQNNKESPVTMVTKVVGPEMGYITTPICVVNCAYTFLNEKQRGVLPNGVLTPASAFANVADDLIQRLSSRGVQFIVQEMKGL